jgi:DNA-binding transcriptional LysR family regulator
MNIERLSLDQLRVFVQVVDCGSFLAASRNLARAQSAVSYAIATLENQLGVPLFDRSSYRPTLTEAGTALVRDARQVLDQVDALQIKASGYAKGQELEITLAVDVFFPMGCLTQLLRAFKQVFPSVTVRLEIEALGAVAQQVIDGNAQLGMIATLPLTPTKLMRIGLPNIMMIGVVSPDHPLAKVGGRIPEHLLAHETQLVLSDRSELTASKDYSVHSKLVWRMSDLSTKHVLLRAGMGWGYMPAHMIEEDVASGKLVRIQTAQHPPEGLALPMQCIYNSDYRAGPAASWWLDALAGLTRLDSYTEIAHLTSSTKE